MGGIIPGMGNGGKLPNIGKGGKLGCIGGAGGFGIPDILLPILLFRLDIFALFTLLLLSIILPRFESVSFAEFNFPCCWRDNRPIRILLGL